MAGRLVEKTRSMQDSAHLRITGAKIDPADAGMADRSSTHGAGLKRHIEIRAGEPFLPQGLRGLADDQHFSMSRRVEKLPRSVAIGGDDLAIHHQNRADRNLITPRGLFGLFERDVHGRYLGRSVFRGVDCHPQGLPQAVARRQKVP
jgi:hypothetical protein